MISFIHIADLHYGVENYGHIDPNTGLHTRLQDFDACMRHIVDQAIAKNVDLVILAGDAYKTANPSPTQQKLLLHQLLRLQQSGIQVVIVVGNHDHPISFGKAHALDVYADLPVHGFHVIANPSAIKLNTRNGPVNIVGVPWPCRPTLLAAGIGFSSNIEAKSLTSFIAKQTLALINQLAGQLEPEVPAILAGHLTVDNGIFSGSERRATLGKDPLFTVEQLAIPPFNYVALGHLHRHQNLASSGQTPVVYAGSIERVDFGEVRDTKGFCYGQIQTLPIPERPGQWIRKAWWEFLPLPTRPMLELNIVLKEDRPANAQILDLLAQQSLEGAIVKLMYHLPWQSRHSVDINLLRNAMQSAWHIASIQPIYPLNKVRSLRLEQGQKLSDEELLQQYLQLQGLSTNKIQQLLTLATNLRQSIENETDACHDDK